MTSHNSNVICIGKQPHGLSPFRKLKGYRIELSLLYKHKLKFKICFQSFVFVENDKLFEDYFLLKKKVDPVKRISETRKKESYRF